MNEAEHHYRKFLGRWRALLLQEHLPEEDRKIASLECDRIEAHLRDQLDGRRATFTPTTVQEAEFGPDPIEVTILDAAPTVDRPGYEFTLLVEMGDEERVRVRRDQITLLPKKPPTVVSLHYRVFDEEMLNIFLRHHGVDTSASLEDRVAEALDHADCFSDAGIERVSAPTV